MSSDGQAVELFEAVLADPASQDWPFDRARVQLLYGERLRRAREVSRARQHLKQAYAAFPRLGASVWANRPRRSWLQLPRSGGARMLTRPGS